MAKIYVYQIKTGKMSIDNVPERWREAVKNIIDKESDQNDKN